MSIERLLGEGRTGRRRVLGIAALAAAAALWSVVPSPAAEPAGTPTGRIEGQVLDAGVVGLEKGAPLPSGFLEPAVRVKAIRVFAAGGREAVAETIPDAQGRFALNGVPAGNLALEPVLTVTRQDDPESPVVYEGGTVTLRALRVPTSVVSDQTTRVGLFGRGRPVAGKVTGPEGVAVETVHVAIIPVNQEYAQKKDPAGRVIVPAEQQVHQLLTLARRKEAKVNAQGDFRFEGVREGTYLIHAFVNADDRPEGKPLRLWVEESSQPARKPAAEPAVLPLPGGEFSVDATSEGVSSKPLELGTLRLRVISD